MAGADTAAKDNNRFVEDISAKGIIYAITIRSPVSRGVLKVIEHPKLPNSYHLITAEDIPGKNHLADFSLPILADKKISYKGQPVAILAGPDDTRLEEFASQFKIVIDEETPVFSVSNDPENTIIRREIVSENPDKAFTETEKHISGTYFTGIEEHWYTEPHGAVAIPFIPRHAHAGKVKNKEEVKKEEETLTVYTATQWPFHVKRSIVQVLGIDAAKITVIPTKLAVHLDGKLWYPSLVACHAALTAWIIGHPARLILTKEEDFLYSPKRNSSEISIRSAIGEKGEILGSSVNVTLDLGSDGIFEDEIIDHTCLGAMGAYKHRAYHISGNGIRTNVPPQGPFAGFGLAQGFFAAERQASRVADTLRMDPAEWRKNNFIQKDQKLITGTTLKNSMPLAELIDAAALMSDYYRKWASNELLRQRRRGKKWEFGAEALRGVGIATAYQGNGFFYNNEKGKGACAVELTLEKDGFLEIKTNTAIGNGILAAWQNIAEEILDVDPAHIRFSTNSGNAPDSGPSTLSRDISCLTKLVERCCSAIRKQRFRDPLPITVKRAAKAAKGQVWIPGKNADPDTFSRPAWGAAVAEIEIEPVSFTPVIRGIWLAVDGGKILSQLHARRALTTGIINAIGWTFREDLRYENGEIPWKLYRSYDIPALSEIPPIHVDFIWNDTSDPKGIGDLPFCCVPAALVQAVSQAMDHPFNRIPISPQDIWDAARQKETEENSP